MDLRQQTGRINGLGIDRAGALWSLHPPPFDCLIFGPNMEKLEARSGHRLFYWPLFYYFVLAPRTICRPPSGGKARKMRQGWMDACLCPPFDLLLLGGKRDRLPFQLDCFHLNCIAVEHRPVTQLQEQKWLKIGHILKISQVHAYLVVPYLQQPPQSPSLLI